MKLTREEARHELALHADIVPEVNELRFRLQIIEREMRAQYDPDTGTVHPHLVITKRTGWQEF